LYLTRTGILEPLGQSQVLSYLKGLSSDYSITLISFERDIDLRDQENFSKIKALCTAHNIRWIRLNYKRKPRIMASTVNLVQLVWRTWREVKHTNAKLIHARAYIPAAAAWWVSRITGVAYIFDMRSLWPEELITSKRLRRDSQLHKLIFYAENRLLRDASAVVSLTQAGAHYLERIHLGALPAYKLYLIPTCTDLNRFRQPIKEVHEFPLIGCHGSINSGWFRVDLLARMFFIIAEHLPSARFEIITREDPVEVLRSLNLKTKDSVSREFMEVSSHSMPTRFIQLRINSVRASEIHNRIQQQSLSLFFYATGADSELGRSPTRMGEALGCGVPVLTNKGIGDVTSIVCDNNVGVIIEDEIIESLNHAANSAIALIGNPDVATRCRQTAERLYSLESGIKSYKKIYRKIRGCPS
jgi:glycosyltransferase involved in cell wall biosynthesis